MWNCHYPDGALPTNCQKGSFWWKDILKSLTAFKGMASAQVTDGSTCQFWVDIWNGRLLSSLYPELFSFAKDRFISVSSFINSVDFSDLFHLPLSSQAFAQYQILVTLVEATQLQEGKDSWSYIWGTFQFTSKSAYLHLSSTRQVHPAFKWLWNSYCQPKRKFFFWLLLNDRLSTRELLRRKIGKL